MSVKCKDIIKLMEEIAPLRLAIKGDNVGLLIGNEDADIENVMVTLDIDDMVIDEAIECGCNMIITHHPVIFYPLKSINIKHPKERLIYKIISNNINIYSAHTNLDAADDGINDYLAKKLHLNQVSILEKTCEDMYYKLAVYVPENFESRVWEAMVQSGAGHIGNYSSCTFSLNGTGTFMPLEGSAPFIGESGHVEHVKETKIETIVSSEKLPVVIDKMLEAHPYEEVAYDVYPLVNGAKEYGFGRTGYLENPISLKELCILVKDILHIDYVNVTGSLDREVKKIAVSSGSGADFITNAFNAGCDAYITGDIGYHDSCDARDMGIAVIDAGHFATENIYMSYLYEYIKKVAGDKNYNINIALSKNNKNPYVVV